MSTKVRYFQFLVSPHVGGGAKLAMEIHNHATSTRGPVSELLLPKGGDAERTALWGGLPFTDYRLDRLTSSSQWRSGLANLRLCAKTAKYRRGVIHVHSPFVYGAARPFFLLSCLKTVLHVHLDFTVDQLRWALKVPPDLIFVCADFMRPKVEQALAERKGKRSVIRVIRNAVDTERFFPSNRIAEKANLGLGQDMPLLVMAANLAPHKGQETAIRTVAVLKTMGHEVRLWLVGTDRDDGSAYLRALKAVCAELSVDDRVDFVGFRNDIPELLRAADFVLLPSTNEGLPLVILEAQASKALVLAAPTAGIPEVIDDGRTGYLIAADDPQGYANQIASLLKNPIQANAITEAAYHQVHGSHSMKRYCEVILCEYDKLLNATY
jgi:glycosyltransferase involved in cell wall biosynthesis